jgi:hypothetical protein
MAKKTIYQTWTLSMLRCFEKYVKDGRIDQWNTLFENYLDGKAHKSQLNDLLDHLSQFKATPEPTRTTFTNYVYALSKAIQVALTSDNTTQKHFSEVISHDLAQAAQLFVDNKNKVNDLKYNYISSLPPEQIVLVYDGLIAHIKQMQWNYRELGRIMREARI